jgi:hypothetical protein
MKTNISKPISHSLLIDSDDVFSLYSYIVSKYKGVEITGNCNDGSQLETNDIQDLLQFENLNHRKIVSISFYARNDTNEYHEKFALSIKDSTFSSAELDLSSNNDEKALIISQEIQKRLAGMKPAYDWIARVPLPVALLVFGFVVISFIGTGIFLGVIHLVNAEKAFGVGDTISFMFSLAIYIVVVLPLEKLRKFLFPKVFFLIGKQKKTMETIHFWRNLIFGTVIGAILIGLIVNWISNTFFK